MRLQLLIQRHAFPPVHIIYTTGAGPASHTRSRDSTIADLLNDVNDIVPLESADGEWGLEDYAVEVAATADQSSLYECLHYQTCESVLREDDEVIIRALTSEDLRVRRLGGRHQITGDGRHLVDGIPFGKQWLRRTNRPGIVIPPRKKRRLLAEEPNSDDDEKVKQILPAESEEDYTGALVPFISDDEEEDEDDEEDEDFVEEEEPDQVTLREDFDDADAESDHDEEEAGDGLDDEVKVLLRDAEDIASAGGGAAARSVFERRLKRKRDIDDEGQPYEDDTFEGFSTPAKSPRKGIIDNDDKASADSDEDSMMADIATRQAEKRALNVVDDDEDLDEDEEDSDFNSLDSNTGEDRRAPTKDEKDEEPDTDSSSDVETSSSGSEADSMLDKLAMEQAKKRALNLVNASGSDLLEDSEADEDFSTPQAEEVAQQVVDGTSSSSSESDTSSESEEDSESDSELSESDSESEDDEEKGREGRKAVPDSLPAPLPTTKVSATDLQFNQSPATSAPGQGMARTHRNNDRVKKRKRLEALKMQGLLPANADFKALAEYDEQGQNQGAVDVDQAEAAVNEPEVERNVVAETIVDAEMTGPDETADITTHEVVDDKRVEDIGMTANLIVACSAEVPKTAPNKEAGTVTEPAPKRARLDLASSRRMLFSSLGLRTPKTPEAEQALREKLSKSIRPTKQVAGPINGVEASTGQPHALMEDEDSWKDKLVVSAVECEEYVGPMEPPPFPFKQGWTKPARDGNKKKRQSRDQSQYYQSRDEQDPTSNDQDFAPDVSTLGTDEETKPTPNTGTKAPETASTTPSGISLPTDFQTLPALTQENIRPGAVIAYQELHVDASTSWQPEISTYRVGDISHLDQDGTIHVKLDPSSLKPKLEVSTEDTEESKTYGFELEGEDKSQEDDGIREIQFSDMISAKLVKASSVEVPESSHVNGVGLRGGDASASSNGDHFAVIPESAEQDSTSQAPIQPQISVEDIATPRRNEISVIIKEAGFNSALDEQLLQPNMNSTQFRQSASASGEVDEGTTYTSRKRSPLLDFVPSEDQQSSVVDENDWHLHEEGPDANFDSEPPISSPYVHTQESVEYPHISQMALNSSGVVQTNTSSSHQDAQKLPLTPVVDLAFTISAQETSVSQAAENEVELETKSELVDEEESEDQGNASGEDEPDDDSEYQDSSAPLKSEVSQSQLLDAYEGISQEPRSQRDSSFLGGLGHDGHDSSYHDDDDDEDVDGNSDNNSDDLPSLRELTSSQQVRVQTRSISKKVSPPATRKSRRKSDRIKSSTPPSSPELPPSSQPEPKLSQSEEPRMSQIPIGSKIVDLTQSSDGSSPIKGDDGFYSTKTRTRAQVNGHRNSQGSAARKVSGLGTKRLLTTKKSRNYF